MQFYYHPLSSFCWKVLIALYEKNAAFEPVLVDLGDPDSASAFAKLSPMRKIPALVSDGEVVFESSIEIEYLDLTLGGAPLTPKDARQALDVRLWDRFFDSYVHYPMQAIVANRLRPAERKDQYGVAETRAKLGAALDVVEARMKGRVWAAGEGFSMADCAAAPALYYANLVLPFGQTHPATTEYLKRLSERPSFARVLKEAAPYLHFFPSED